MVDINVQLERLKRGNKNERYDACEELRVAPFIPTEAIEALKEALHDPEPDVVDAAKSALAVHFSEKNNGQEFLPLLTNTPAPHLSSEKDYLKVIEANAKALAKSASEAEYWHKKAIEEIEEKQKKRQAEIDEELHHSIAAAEEEYQGSIGKIRENLATIEGQYNNIAELNWDSPKWNEYLAQVESEIPHLMRIGQLMAKGKKDSIEMPAFLPILDTNNILIKASGVGKDNARALIQSIMLKMLGSLPSGKLRFICIDPVGLGSTMAGFIKDLPDILTGGQAWYDQMHIEQRLSELEAQMALIKQKYLGIHFSSMEEYNAQAGQIEEPYRLLVISDFPARFTDSAAQKLISIATNGPSTGVYVLIMVDEDQSKMPYSFNMQDLERTASIIKCDKDGSSIWVDEDFQKCELMLDKTPSETQFEMIIKSIRSQALLASEVRLPFNSIVPESINLWKGDSREGIKIPIGQFGAREFQYFILDEKLLSSALIIGKTGSGKSTLLHIIINGLALAYSPDEIEMYLLDLKEVEFKDYASFHLPHAKVVAINCEREFGLSVLRGLDQELRRRMDTFRNSGFTSLSDYRSKTGNTIPRVLLLIDEFQELFSNIDGIATDLGLILDRLVRQGRAFGINIILASQTLAGEYTFSSSTKNQIPVRIALQCSEFDSRLILNDDNYHASLLERPGEAIYNAKNGRVEGNNRFQVAWMGDDEREFYNKQIQDIARKNAWIRRQAQILFEGNAPGQLENNPDLISLLNMPNWPAQQKAQIAWLGEPIEIKAHTSAKFRRQSRSNLLIVGQNEYEQNAMGMFTSIIMSLALQQTPDSGRFMFIDLSNVDAEWAEIPETISANFPHSVKIFGRRTIHEAIDEISLELNNRMNKVNGNYPSIYFMIFGLQRDRDLRKDDSLMTSSWGQANEVAEKEKPIIEKLTTICREGPDIGIHTIIWCDTYANLSRAFDRKEQGEFDIRIALQMGENDSRNLIDSDAATKLGSFRAIYYDEERTGSLEKFRPYSYPDSNWIVETGKKLCNRKQ